MTNHQLFQDHLEPWTVTDPRCGVVTASDSRFFYGLQLLLQTLLGRVAVTVIDLGLTAFQRRWLQAQGITVKPCPLTPTRPATHKTSWLKPWWIQQAGYEHTLWLDADTLVLRDLTPLFERLGACPLLIQHPYREKSPSGYRSVLHTRFPVKKPNTKSDTLNAGVLGFAPGRAGDQELLQTWQGLIEAALADKSVMKHIQYWDEGALHWTVAKLALQQLLVRDRPGWDRFVYMTHVKDPEDFYKRLPIQDGDTVLHLIGKKPWIDWNTWMPR